MSTPSKSRAEAIPIRIVLYRDVRGGDLKQKPFTSDERQQLQDRYDEIDSGSPGQAAPFYEAFYHASRRHPAEPEPLIVVSRSRGDEMTWQVLDETGVPEPDFDVFILPQHGSDPDPLDGFPKNAGRDKIVHSGPPKNTHLRKHYKFKVVARDGKTFDPDWYAGD